MGAPQNFQPTHLNQSKTAHEWDSPHNFQPTHLNPIKNCGNGPVPSKANSMLRQHSHPLDHLRDTMEVRKKANNSISL
jgi:hypothetical protein